MTDKTPTIGFVIDDLEYGGAQGQLAILVRTLRGRVRPIVYVASVRTHPWAAVMRDDGVTVREFPRRVRFDAGFTLALARSMRADGVDIVHGFLNPANAYATAAARINRQPVVLSLRSDRMVFPWLHNQILRRCFRKARAVTANSRAGHRFLLDDVGTRAERTHLIRNWIQMGDAEPRDNNERTVGFVGRFVPLKRIALLVEAFGLLRQSLPDARLVLVGDGPEHVRMRELVRRLDLTASVEFSGAIENARSLIRTFDCLVIPSNYEGLPNVALEALAEGVPVVARPVGDVPDVVIEGETGHLLVSPDSETLAELLLSVLNDPSLAARTRARGAAIIAENFSPEAGARAHISLYESLL